MPQANIFDGDCAYDPSDPDGYRSGVCAVGEAADGHALTVKVYEIPPGQSVCPYHYEYEEEWLVVLEGAILVRTPDGERELTRGELLCFPPGPLGAHKATNRSLADARVMMFSSAREPSVAVYPDSDKLGVWPGNAADNLMVRRVDGRVDYWHGES